MMKPALILSALLCFGVADAAPEKQRNSLDYPVQLEPSESLSTITRLDKTSELLGTEIRNPRNERLGEVKEMMFSLGDGRIPYVVMGTGGFLGIGDKSIALPATALAPSPDARFLVLEADREALRAAPGFDQGNWPETAQFEPGAGGTYAGAPGDRTIDEAAGAERIEPEAATEESPAQPLEQPTRLRASELIGMTVRDVEGRKLGDIRDIAVDLASGNIRYLVVSTGGLLRIGERLFAVAPQEFRSGTTQRTLVLEASREVLRTANSFDRHNWPETADRAFSPMREPAGSPRTDSRTALDQSNQRRDLMITQQLRRAIMADETMSLLTRNITIITADGRITVRGVVASEQEVERIVAFAREIAGNEVTNELRVQNQKGGKNETTERDE